MSAKKISRSSASRAKPAPIGAEPFGSTSAADETMLLALAAPLVAEPSPTVKNNLLTRIAAQRRGEGAASPIPVVQSWRFQNLTTASEGWVKLPIPGVRLREIALDPARDTALLFIEMAPGSIFPDHDHTATERGLMLTGDLRMGDRLLQAGDFYEAAAGTRHERIASPSGCTGLLWVGAQAWQRWRAMAVA